MIVGIIGYRNHSQKLLNILKKIKKVKKIIIYNYKLNKNFVSNKDSFEILTGKLSILHECNAVFVSSPVSTHYKYTDYFLKKNIYVFCEKPPFSNIKEINKIKRVKNFRKLYFNFNYQFLKSFKFLVKEIFNKKNGKLININFASSHGLIFKIKNNWRFKKKNNKLESIYGNLGIHYIYFLFNNFKKIELIKKNFQTNRTVKIFDTVNINLKLNNKVFSNIFLSYATVNFKYTNLYFTNCLIEIKNDRILKYYPRNVYDKSGKFKTPRPKIIKLNNKKDIEISLIKSIKFFLNIVSKDETFSKKSLNLALKVNNFFLKN